MGGATELRRYILKVNTVKTAEYHLMALIHKSSSPKVCTDLLLKHFKAILFDEWNEMNDLNAGMKSI